MTTPESAPAAPFSYAGLQAVAPAATAALRALSQSVDAGLDKGLVELVKIRVSQINGCAFCTAFHIALARRLGVDAAKIDLVAVWRDAGLFAPRERAALAWAEQLAGMAGGPMPEDAVARLGEIFAPDEVVHLTIAIATINAWNRIAGGLRFPPPS